MKEEKPGPLVGGNSQSYWNTPFDERCKHHAPPKSQPRDMMKLGIETSAPGGDQVKETTGPQKMKRKVKSAKLQGYRPKNSKASPLQSIRKHCLSCCGGCRAEVRDCEIEDCWLWPYRMGKRA